MSPQRRARVRDLTSRFADHSATRGIIMLICVIVALIIQNSWHAYAYRAWLETPAGFFLGSLTLEKPILMWINDGLITIFFFTIGLELKQEFKSGLLSSPQQLILPLSAAAGGIIFPALTFTLFNFNNAYNLQGWAIPTATDTAFAMTIVMMLGNKVPPSVRTFLLTMSIFDDVGAILVIALFYTDALSALSLLCAGAAILGMLFLNFMGFTRRSFYLILGTCLWLSILHSGVHATLAGIITALMIPSQDETGRPLAQEINSSAQLWVTFLILPLFAFANAGIDLSGITLNLMFSNVSLGIFFGLLIGKPAGVILMIYLCRRFKLAPLPHDANMHQLKGAAMLTGVGFTMAFFIDGLAYKISDIFSFADNLAIMLGSAAAGLCGYLYLRYGGNPKQANPEDASQAPADPAPDNAAILKQD